MGFKDLFRPKQQHSPVSPPTTGYRLLKTPVPVEELDDGWGPLQEAFTHIVGISGLGHLFLVNTGTGEYAVHHPLLNAYKSYGSFGSLSDFEKSLLLDPDFAVFVLRIDFQREIEAWLGQLEGDQVYIPTPYPFMSGDSDDPAAYDKGDVWVFLSIVHQMLN
ncbi:hypothetical protein [Arthrobacter sp. UYCu712]|uniref:hypothetical protein n=1 Tax=Arthrobacter sp. UYCu712 TaxID=3156340 RepID=UPI003393B172